MTTLIGSSLTSCAAARKTNAHVASPISFVARMISKWLFSAAVADRLWKCSA